MRQFVTTLLLLVLLAVVALPALAQEAEDYVVQPGDTLSAIANAFELPIQGLARANGIANLDLIFVGETLVLQESATAPATYTVRPGDTLSAIATRFDTTISDLLAANEDIVNRNLIFVGQGLTIPAATE